MNTWLQNFAYRVDMSWWVFALAGSFAVSIAILTIGYQTLKAAVANPVKSLKVE
jgi:putative ABC transport system permease protein